MLLTGSTGYLGTEILSQLMTQNLAADIILLVRADNVAQVRARVVRTASAAGCWLNRYSFRIEIRLGDLAKPNMGIDADS